MHKQNQIKQAAMTNPSFQQQKGIQINKLWAVSRKSIRGVSQAIGLTRQRLSISCLKYSQIAKAYDIQRTKESHVNDRDYLIENIHKERSYKKESNKNS